MTNLPKKIPAGPLEAMRLLNEIKSSIDDYVRITQGERTARAGIKAKSAVAVAHIDAQKEVLLEYLRLAHDSRADFFKRSFASLDAALEQSDAAVVANILTSITQVARQTPFADLKDVGDVRRIWDGDEIDV